MLDSLQNPTLIRLILTGLLLVALFVVRHLAARWITGPSHILQEQQRRQLFWLRSGITVTFLLGLLLVWGGHLQNLVLSLTAVMVAVVIATKELLMCVSGFLMRTTGRLFSVGDWVECNGLRGEVTDHSLLSTTLLEVEPSTYGYGYTGRMLNLPNSLFLSHPVHTSPFARHYVPHPFKITVEESHDTIAALEWIRDEAARICAPFMDEARRINENMERHLGVDVPDPEPFATVGTSDIGKVLYRIRIFCPRERTPALEGELTGRFLNALRSGRFSLDTGDRPGEAAGGG